MAELEMGTGMGVISGGGIRGGVGGGCTVPEDVTCRFDAMDDFLCICHLLGTGASSRQEARWLALRNSSNHQKSDRRRQRGNTYPCKRFGLVPIAFP